jgi:hypothetical protein
MYLVVEPSEEKLPQIEETDVDIAAEKYRELVQKEAKYTTALTYLRMSFSTNSSESASFVL